MLLCKGGCALRRLVLVLKEVVHGLVPSPLLEEADLGPFLCGNQICRPSSMMLVPDIVSIQAGPLCCECGVLQ